MSFYEFNMGFQCNNIYTALVDECSPLFDADKDIAVDSNPKTSDHVKHRMCNRPLDDDRSRNRQYSRKRRPGRRGKKHRCKTRNTNFKIAFNNIQGVKSKQYDLKHFVKTNHIDIIGLVETFRKDDQQVHVNGYNWVGKNRINDVKKSQGGIGFLIKDNVSILDDNVFDTKMDRYERLWVKVQMSESTDSVCYIAVAYFPCEGTDRPLTDEIYVSLLSEVLKLQQNDPNANVIVMGDFNGKIGKNPLNEDQSVNYNNGQGLLDFCDAGDLSILNLSDKCTGVYTWVRNKQRSVLDYVCVSQNVINILDNVLIDDEGIHHLGSDHNMIVMTIKYTNNTVSKDISKGDFYWNIKPNQDWGPYKEALNTKFHNWDPINLSANEAWNEWKDGIISAAKETIGCKYKDNKCKAWFDKEILEGINKRKDACRAHRSYSKKNDDPDFDGQFCDSLWEDYQKKRIDCKSLIKRKIMQMRVDRCSDIMKKGGPQTRDFWQQLKGNKPINKVSSIKIPGTNQTTSDKNVMKTTIMRYYNTLGKMAQNLYNEEDDSTSLNFHDTSELNRPTGNAVDVKIDKLCFSIDDVIDAISHCKLNKSPGPDKITNELIKNGGDALVTSLFNLFKRLATVECIPDEWNEGIIIPIFKKGDVKDLDNYRGITLTSCVSKVYNRIIAQNVSKFIEDNNILTEVQGSFRKDRRCEDHIFSLKSIIATRQAEGKQTYLAFLDFKKAFDTVWREGLFNTIKNVGIEGNLLNIIMNLYKNVKSKVIFQDVETDLFDVDEGVKQGCVLSPIIFCIYINELAKMIKAKNLGVSIYGTKIGCLFWADDVVLIGNNDNDLNQLLNTASEFSYKCKMAFNFSKSNVLITGQRVNVDRKWKLCNSFITEVNVYKYLGVIISRNNSDHSHIDEVIKRGNRLIAYIKSIIDDQDDFNRVYYGDLLWKSIGLPSINYACAIWFCKGNTVIDKLENIQYQMARVILKAPRNVAKEALYGDLGWQSIVSIQSNIRVQYFKRLQDMDDHRLPKSLFRAINQVNDSMRWDWLRNIKDSLEKCNLSMFYDHGPFDQLKSNWLTTFKNVNKANDHDNWRNNALKKSSLVNYIRHKEKPSLEPYLLDKLNFNGSNLKFKARSNSLDLEGRKKSWSDNNNGLCKLCNLNQVETIDHFMLECRSLDHIRNDHFENLKRELYCKGWDMIWQIFLNGDVNLKHHLLLDNIFEDNFDLGCVLDKCCKSLLSDAWKERNNILKEL